MWRVVFIYGKWVKRKATYEARRCAGWVAARSARDVRSLVGELYVVVTYEEIIRCPSKRLIVTLDEKHGSP